MSSAKGAAPAGRKAAGGAGLAGGAMRDGFGRRIEYLRVSVTDKCNLRCVYCMPLHGLPWLKRSDLLTYEEIAELVGVMAPMGLRRVRLTGGEPLVRPDLPVLARLIRAVPVPTSCGLAPATCSLVPSCF